MNSMACPSEVDTLEGADEGNVSNYKMPLPLQLRLGVNAGHARGPNVKSHRHGRRWPFAFSSCWRKSPDFVADVPSWEARKRASGCGPT